MNGQAPNEFEPDDLDVGPGRLFEGIQSQPKRESRMRIAIACFSLFALVGLAGCQTNNTGAAQAAATDSGTTPSNGTVPGQSRY